MKKLILILFLIPVFLHAQFPVKISRPRVDAQWVLKNESKYFNKNINNLGTYPLIVGTGVTTNNAWRTATKPTVTANSWYGTSTIAQPDPGRRLVITKIVVQTTDQSQFALIHVYNRKQSLDGTNGSISQAGGINQIMGSQENAGGGSVTFDYAANPLMVTSGQSLSFYLYSQTTTGTNWNIYFEGYDLTDDANYNADFAMLILGNSIASQTGDTNMEPYIYRENGSINGIWGNIIQQHLQENGINIRRAVIGIGGTTAIDWDALVNSKRVQYWGVYDLVLCELGMNDCISDAGLTVTAGVDGNFKKAYKNIIHSYFRENPKGSFIANSITATDLSTRVATVATGIYAGQQRVVAYRQEIAAVVSELKAAYPTWDLQFADVSTAYTASQTTYFAETTIGTLTHPNTTLGQPAMAVILNSKVDLTQFYLNNHK
jgi:hypothetical protein